MRRNTKEVSQKASDQIPKKQDPKNYGAVPDSNSQLLGLSPDGAGKPRPHHSSVLIPGSRVWRGGSCRERARAWLRLFESDRQEEEPCFGLCCWSSANVNQPQPFGTGGNELLHATYNFVLFTSCILTTARHKTSRLGTSETKALYS